MIIVLFRRQLAALSVLVAAMVAPLSAQNAPASLISAESADNETPQLWFVGFASLPSAAGGAKKTAKAERDALSRAAKAAGIR